MLQWRASVGVVRRWGKAVLPVRCCGELSVVVRDLEQGSVVQGWACRRFDAWDADAGLAGPRLWDDGGLDGGEKAHAELDGCLSFTFTAKIEQTTLLQIPRF